MPEKTAINSVIFKEGESYNIVPSLDILNKYDLQLTPIPEVGFDAEKQEWDYVTTTRLPFRFGIEEITSSNDITEEFIEKMVEYSSSEKLKLKTIYAFLLVRSICMNEDEGCTECCKHYNSFVRGSRKTRTVVKKDNVLD